MTRDDVVSLMKSSVSEAQWDANCDKVKAACGGYPPFWFEAILRSGVAHETMAAWGGTDQIRVVPL
jgi:hypothetical protein